MGRTYNGHGTEVSEWRDRDTARSNRRAARESWLVRGEGTKKVDPMTGLTLSVPRTAEGGSR